MAPRCSPKRFDVASGNADRGVAALEPLEPGEQGLHAAAAPSCRSRRRPTRRRSTFEQGRSVEQVPAMTTCGAESSAALRDPAAGAGAARPDPDRAGRADPAGGARLPGGARRAPSGGRRRAPGGERVDHQRDRARPACRRGRRARSRCAPPAEVVLAGLQRRPGRADPAGRRVAARTRARAQPVAGSGSSVALRRRRGSRRRTCRHRRLPTTLAVRRRAMARHHRRASDLPER